MMELGSVERRIIKRDAKMVVTDHALAFFLVSLPVTILELLFVFRAAFSAPEWVKWIVIGLLAVFLYLPLTIGQAAYLLGEIRQKPCHKSVVFRWLTSPRLYGKTVVYVLTTLMLYGVYALACYLLSLPVSFGAAQFAEFIGNPGAEEYINSIFMLLAVLGASVLELFLSPAKNYLAGEEELGAVQIIRKSFRTARLHLKPLFLLRLTWIGWIAGVYFLDGAAGGNLVTAMTQPNGWMGALYGGAALLFYLISFFVGIYMDTANLSFNELCIVRSKTAGEQNGK
jgi:hypothetical protein